MGYLIRRTFIEEKFGYRNELLWDGTTIVKASFHQKYNLQIILEVTSWCKSVYPKGDKFHIKFLSDGPAREMICFVSTIF